MADKQQAPAKDSGKANLGVSASRDDIGDWFSQLLLKAEMIEYTDVSGCYILRPRLYAMWEATTAFLDKQFKDDGVQNAAFPLLIPESNLTKEKQHVKGFNPEVAWVTHAGDTKLPEKLAIRPTSETIMYPSYAKWIRSYRDLPLRLNQWCSVVRWEFKHPVALLRSREFWWQEGHTAFATKQEADDEVKRILGFYQRTYEELMAVPVIPGTKTKNEKFAGADYSLSLEAFLPSGKGAQACTSHHLGQNFSKAFGIVFADKDEKEKFVYQNSWGFTTRSIGVMILMHADDKGIVIPPRIAGQKAVIVPIIFEDKKQQTLDACNIVKEMLSGINAFVDDRQDKTPGFKYNEWEMKGIPLRIEIGPKDLEKQSVMLVRRDNGVKTSVPMKDLPKAVNEQLNAMQIALYEKAKRFMVDSTVAAKNMPELQAAIKAKKLVKAGWCMADECEDKVKEEAGAGSLNIPFDQPKDAGNCVVCGNAAKVVVYFAKRY